ncbi:unnamed protein product [Microthlaspi erraticum]|uniref:NYN domain-containing protein n=1 Tax=Microthlaspi erraticum TaxID=1685480 RepID=A0A6D2LIK9_9BRAS|nr:unnamed protein product [Microthlaspi erraticum]
MVICGNSKAAPELVNSKTWVLWDMDSCPVPDGYDARRVRPSIESALKNLGYMGPVTISAMGNLEKIPSQVLQGLSSTGIAVKHCLSEAVDRHFYNDISEFKSLNPPPATIMIISDKVESEMTPDLCRSQQIRCGYNLVLASIYPTRGHVSSYLHTTAEWLWETMLGADQQETRSFVLHKCTESGKSTPLFCGSCNFTAPSVTNLTRHLSSKKHKRAEIQMVESMKPDPALNYWDEHPKGKASFNISSYL